MDDLSDGEKLRDKLIASTKGVFVGHTHDDVCTAVFGLLISVVRISYGYTEKEAAGFIEKWAKDVKRGK